MDILQRLDIKPFTAVGHNLKKFRVVNYDIKSYLTHDRIRGEKDRFGFESAPLKDKLHALVTIYPYTSRSKFKVFANISIFWLKNSVQQRDVFFEYIKVFFINFSVLCIIFFAFTAVLPYGFFHGYPTDTS